jgi:hypothetical protein
MTDRAQFEAMLEALINEDQDQAKEIFHQIVVGKSREIYEELLAEDFGADQGNPYEKKDDEEESEDDGEEKEENPFAKDDDSEDDDEESDDEEGDDEESDEEGGEGEGDIEDRVMDLEDALEDLKAEFEQLLQGEEHEEEQDPGHHGDIHAADIEADMHDMDDEEAEPMMEYTLKVGKPQHGDNGTNTRSTIDNMKNDMGGTTANIAQGFSTTTGGTKGGLAKPTTEDLTAGLGEIQNRAGISKSKSFTKKEPGHGAEKKGTPPGNNVGAGTGKNSKDGEKNTQSFLKQAKK